MAQVTLRKVVKKYDEVEAVSAIDLRFRDQVVLKTVAR